MARYGNIVIDSHEAAIGKLYGSPFFLDHIALKAVLISLLGGFTVHLNEIRGENP